LEKRREGGEGRKTQTEVKCGGGQLPWRNESATTLEGARGRSAPRTRKGPEQVGIKNKDGKGQPNTSPPEAALEKANHFNVDHRPEINDTTEREFNRLHLDEPSGREITETR